MMLPRGTQRETQGPKRSASSDEEEGESCIGPKRLPLKAATALALTVCLLRVHYCSKSENV